MGPTVVLAVGLALLLWLGLHRFRATPSIASLSEPIQSGSLRTGHEPRPHPRAVRTPAAPDVDTDGAIEFTVRSLRTHDPVREASVFVLVEEAPIAVGVTDASGRFTFEGQGLANLITADGFASTRVPYVSPGPCEVLLEEEGAIHGIVTDGDGVPLPNVPVVAWEPGSVWTTSQELIAAFQGDARFVRTVADEAGEFCLRGIDARKRYWLLAGGLGFAMPRAAEIEPGEYAELALEPIRGAILLYPSVGMPSVAAAAIPQFESVEFAARTDVLDVSANKYALSAYALPPGFKLLSGNSVQRPLFYMGPALASPDVRARYSVHISGYAPVDIELELRRPDDPSARQEVPMLEESSLGVLEVTARSFSNSS